MKVGEEYVCISRFRYKTYEDYKRNSQDIFYIFDKMVDEYINKHPEIIKQAVNKSLEKYINIKDLAVGDANVFRVSE